MFWILLFGLHSISAEVNSPAVYADHHVHLLGPRLLKDWKSTGMPFSRADSVYTSAEGLLGNSASASDKLQQAILVPMAHLYGNTEFREKLRIAPEEEHRRVRRENDHVSQEAKRYGNRAVAFCSVNFLRPYAWEELRRCRSELGIRGLKLHLANSEVDLRNDQHLKQLARVVRWAETEGLAVLLHFDPQRRGLEVKDVNRFIQEVLAPHPKLKISIAHLGGSGGYGPWTQSVFKSFSGWLEQEAANGNQRTGIFFDLSAVILEEESDGVPATTSEEAAALALDLRKAGFNRILFASDYPVFSPEGYLKTLKAKLKLNNAEISTILRNRLPVLSPEPQKTLSCDDSVSLLLVLQIDLRAVIYACL